MKYLSICLCLLIVSCHEDEDDKPKTVVGPAELSEEDEENLRRALFAQAAFADVQEAVTLAGEMIRIWNATHDKPSARQRAVRIKELAESVNVAMVEGLDPCLDLLREIASGLLRMADAVLLFLDSEEVADLVEANEGLESARRGITSYDRTCGQ
jgi:hypothetical protein